MEAQFYNYEKNERKDDRLLKLLFELEHELKLYKMRSNHYQQELTFELDQSIYTLELLTERIMISE